MIKCGNCRQSHYTADQVRNCYGVTIRHPKPKVTGRQPTPLYAKSHVQSLGAEGTTGRSTTTVVRPATAKMAWKVYYLLKELGEVKGQPFAPESVDEFVAGWQEATFQQTSETIDRLQDDIVKAKAARPSMTDVEGIRKAFAKTDLAGRPAPKVPDGRYAIVSEPGDDGRQVVKFYRVNTPTEGRWAGYTFVDVQASDELYPVKNRDARSAILNAIARDVRGALQLYGQELGHCGHCGRTLTDDLSRERGIGPVCWGKLGY
jgi:hypothetical protein